MKRIAQILFALAVIGLFSGGVVRTWKDKAGQYKDLRAELIKVENGRAHLKRVDGQTIRLALSSLSRYDQLWIQKELKRRAAGGDRPSGPTGSSGTQETEPSGVALTDWPQWRGRNRDGKSSETGLLKAWPPSGPRKLWSASGLGKGFAGVSVVGDRVYTAGRRGSSEYVICLDATSGTQVWAAPLGGGDHTNGTPTVDGNRVYAIGLNGDLVCVDAASGNEIWRRDFQRDFGGKMMSQWGFSESPLVDGDKLVCTPGGNRAMMVALDKESGGMTWAAAMPPVQGKGKDGAGYSSIVISNAGGVKQYVQLVGRGLIGVEADSGRLLWGFNDIANDTANIPTPIILGSHVFSSNGYNAGSVVLKISSMSGRVRATQLYFLPANKLQVHHGGMVYHRGHIYCAHGQGQAFPVCIDVVTGKPTWTPTRGPGTGSAAVAYADGHVYYRYESGVMALVEANPDQYRLKGAFRIATNNDKSWPHPVIANGKLYLRDQDNLHCYDIKSG
jgi:outer membrane protein assembly factor BamB